MTDHPADQMVSFDNIPVRIVMQGAVPFFALADLCEALGLPPGSATAADNPDFPSHAKRTCWEEADDGSMQDATILSPVGVWWLTQFTGPHRGQKLAAWARREAKRIYPDPTPGDPAMFITLTADRKLPPMPYKFSG
ncbi:MAG TPA: hypothetical protein VF463_10060 [Sphingobium sp.]